MWGGIPSGDTEDKMTVKENSESREQYSSYLHTSETICYKTQRREHYRPTIIIRCVFRSVLIMKQDKKVH